MCTERRLRPDCMGHVSLNALADHEGHSTQKWNSIYFSVWGQKDVAPYCFYSFIFPVPASRQVSMSWPDRHLKYAFVCHFTYCSSVSSQKAFELNNLAFDLLMDCVFHSGEKFWTESVSSPEIGVLDAYRNGWGGGGGAQNRQQVFIC